MIYITRFRNSPNGNGGDRYSYQAAQYFKVDEVVKIFDLPQVHISFSAFIKAILTCNFLFIGQYFNFKAVSTAKKKYFSASHFSYYLTCIFRFKNAYQSCQQKTVIVDDPYYSYKLIKKLKNKGCRVIGVIHNIESLAPGQVVAEYQYQVLKKELDKIALCDEVVCISREEHVFLNNLHIKSSWLPYELDDTTLDFWTKVKETRALKSSFGGGYLILGSYNNTPTKLSTDKLVRYIITNELHNDKSFSLVGFDVDKIKYIIDLPDDILIYSSVAREELFQLLIECEGVICYQEKGAGTLTRIQELLAGGIPIIANLEALRQYDLGTSGLKCFSNLEALKKIIADE